MSREHRHVAPPGHLLAGAGEVESDAIAGNRHRDPHRRESRLDTIVVEPLFVGVHTVWNRRDRRPHPALRVVEQLGDRGAHRRCIEGPEEHLDPFTSGAVRGELGTDIAFALARRAGVQREKREDVPHELTVASDAHHRDPQPLLIDAGAVRALAAGHATADVGVMGEVRDKCHEVAVVKDRAHQRDVGKMRAAADIGIVGHEAVAGREGVAGKLDRQLLHQPHERAEVDRSDGGQGDQVPAGVEYADRTIPALANVRRVRRADQGREHLVGDGHEPAPDDLDGDGVGGAGHVDAFVSARVGLSFANASRSPSRGGGKHWASGASI